MEIDKLCALIKTCGESGVSEISFDTLHVKFAPTPPATKREVVTFAEADPLQEQHAILKDTLSLREDDLAMKLITDPAEYERLLVAGELESGEGVHD